MVQNGSEWLRMAHNGSEWLGEVQSKSLKGTEWCGINVLKAQNGLNGLEWYKMPQNGSEWLRIPQNGSE